MTLMVTLDPSLVQRHPKGSTSATDIVSPKEGRFIYCMVERGEESYPFTPLESRVACRGDDPQSLSPLTNAGSKAPRELLTGFTGLEGAGLETICYGGIAAVVSPLRTTSFDLLEKGAVTESILKHQKVNSRIFQSHSVIPVRFGTIADNPVQVRELLRKVYLQVKAALKRLEGKIELVVRASWDLQMVLEEVRGEVSTGTQAHIELEEKIAVGRQVFEVIEARKKVIVETIHKSLYPLAVDFSLGSSGGETVIYDRSYLVEREKEPLFDEAVNRIANEFGEKLTFKYIGPLPPYSFTRLEITQGNFEVVDEARKTLRLPEKASIEEIKASYRKFSLIHHPDRNPDDPRAEERFRDVARAYEILEAYSEDNRWLGKGGIYSFTRDDVESAVMVRGGGALE